MPGLVSTGMGDRIGVQLPVREIYLALINHPGQLSLAIPPWVGEMDTSEIMVMLCGWGVKASIARVSWQVKQCDPYYNMCHTCTVFVLTKP